MEELLLTWIGLLPNKEKQARMIGLQKTCCINILDPAQAECLKMRQAPRNEKCAGTQHKAAPVNRGCSITDMLGRTTKEAWNQTSQAGSQ
jgi:hypothetical protein